jgi:Nif-specific regulatory protein
MLVTVADETLLVAQAVRQVAQSIGAKMAFAGTLHELPLVFDANGLPDLLVVNCTGETTGYEVAARIQRSRYRGRILALVEDLADPGVRHLAGLLQAECVVRPSSTNLLEEIRHLVLCPPLAPPASSQTFEPTPPAFHGIVGRSPKLEEVFARIDKAAAADVNVCIYGESGTGKELIARAIHYASSRHDRPLITLDCTTIPEGLMESDLLGHVKGAFTGAVEHREGVFSLAHTGTLFIDELCELELALQGKLLRVIQNREFVPVGGTKPIRADVRLITATNKDLKAAVGQGAFREDLYYRVAVFMIKVPALRERLEDIPGLVDHFLAKFSRLYNKPLTGVEPRALRRLMALRWPGNVRQLENVLEQAAVLAAGGILTERDLFTEEGLVDASPSAAATYEPGLPLREVERRHILRTLQKVRGNRTEAARLLRISLRSLQYKLRDYVADPNPSREASL